MYKTFTFWSVALLSILLVWQIIPGLSFVSFGLGVPYLITFLVYIIPFIIIPIELKLGRVSNKVFPLLTLFVLFHIAVVCFWGFSKHGQITKLQELETQITKENLNKFSFDHDEHILAVDYEDLDEYVGFRPLIPIVFTGFNEREFIDDWSDMDRRNWIKRLFPDESNEVVVLRVFGDTCQRYPEFIFQPDVRGGFCQAFVPYRLLQQIDSRSIVRMEKSYSPHANQKAINAAEKYVRVYSTKYSIDGEHAYEQFHVQIIEIPSVPVPLLGCMQAYDMSGCTIGYIKNSKKFLDPNPNEWSINSFVLPRTYFYRSYNRPSQYAIPLQIRDFLGLEELNPREVSETPRNVIEILDRASALF